jgi:heme exporter protein B
LLTLPLFIPVLIFGAGAAQSGSDANLGLLGALLILSALFAPLATSAALRISME